MDESQKCIFEAKPHAEKKCVLHASVPMKFKTWKNNLLEVRITDTSGEEVIQQNLGISPDSFLSLRQ